MQAILEELLHCHSTPGDEGEVAVVLAREWQAAGWRAQRHGRFAISANRGDAAPTRPTLLICAHMDSPGFIVDSLDPETGEARLVTLGGASCPDDGADAVFKTAKGTAPGRIHQTAEDCETRPQHFIATSEASLIPGDRACFACRPRTEEDEDNLELLHSPFLDNRLGCALLCELARRPSELGQACNVVLGATACEEMGGFGAPVLARAIQPDIVLCLDATYEAPEQDVRLGDGPVLTLSDASVLLSPADRDRFADFANSRGIPLQTEVYNYSGTDARAFPHQGLPADIYPLLLPTRGNHTPEETACLTDAAHLLTLLAAFAQAPILNAG